MRQVTVAVLLLSSILTSADILRKKSTGVIVAKGESNQVVTSASSDGPIKAIEWKNCDGTKIIYKPANDYVITKGKNCQEKHSYDHHHDK